MDSDILKLTWELALEHGDQFAGFFYAHLHLAHPETRPMFPVSMAQQRDRLVNALGEVISNVDDLDAVVPMLQRLGRDHYRRYGVRARHYPMVAEALLATLAYHLGDAWTPEAELAWTDAYAVVAKVMTDAAEPFDQEVAP
jgi:hemoglobin-like flavoprotein